MVEVGIDVGTHIAKYLGGIFGERMGGNISQDVMDKMTEQGYLVGALSLGDSSWAVLHPSSPW